MNNQSIGILVAEDQPDVRKVLVEQILEHLPTATIDEAADGAKAYDLAMRKHYDVIVTDIEMPHISGVDFIQGIRERKSLNSMTPVIFCSGDLPPLGKLTYLGNIQVLSKPCSSKALTNLIKKVLGRV